MGRFSGDQTDGSNASRYCDQPATQARAAAHGVRFEGERPVGYNGDCVMVDSVRNKRSVSVDSGLQREKPVTFDRHQAPLPISEEEEEEQHSGMEMSDESSAERRKRRPKGGAEGDECEVVNKMTRGKRTAVGASKACSKLRGRVGIH